MSNTMEVTLKGQEIGQLITTKLSELLKKHAGNKVRAKASVKSEVGMYTIQSLIVRRIPLTEGNYKGIVAVVEEVIEKCKNDAEDLKTLESLQV